MAKSLSRYVCQTCGESFLRWEGQCRNCSAWNSLVETLIRQPSGAAGRTRPTRGPAGPGEAGRPTLLRDVAEAELPRLATGLAEFDRVLGGGLVPGSVVLVGGEPGIGKSTLLLQVATALARGAVSAGGWVLYASGEESAAQIRLRASRLGVLDASVEADVRVMAERDIGRITEVARTTRPVLLIVDSIQTATVEELDGPAGSVGQVRESALRLMELAKGEGIAVVLVGHVTKDGSLAGPKTLEHVVDAVVSVEGDRTAALRLLRASKNRFGSTEEIGVFEMGELGLAEVADPAHAFVGHHADGAPGSVVLPTLEGSRPLLVEVQALVAPGGPGLPRRTASGLDPNRLALLIAVLGRRAGVGLGTHDVYVNLAGGLSVTEPALDLPIAIALASSLRDRPISPATVAFGEVGLLGELRSVPGMERRLREAARLGYRRAIVPNGGRHGTSPSIAGMKVLAVETLRDALMAALSARNVVPSASADSALADEARVGVGVMDVTGQVQGPESAERGWISPPATEPARLTATHSRRSGRRACDRLERRPGS